MPTGWDNYLGTAYHTLLPQAPDAEENPGYDHGVDGQKSDRGLIILLWVLGLVVLAFVLLAGIAGLTP